MEMAALSLSFFPRFLESHEAGPCLLELVYIYICHDKFDPIGQSTIALICAYYMLVIFAY